MADTDDVAAWARPEVFPAKPEDSAFGALSRKGRWSGFESLEALSAHVRSSRESLVAVWTPETERTVPPEAVPELLEPLRRRFVDLAEIDGADARRNALIFFLVLLWALYAALARGRAPQDSAEVGLAALLLLVLGLIPWYDAWKARKEAWELTLERLAPEEDEARFERWLSRERAVASVGMLVLLAVGGAVQIWVGLRDSVPAAGLVKEAYAAGEWWRLLTAPFLHGHPLHWVLNAAGLWYIGHRVEALAGWPHLVLVFVVAMIAGGIATATMTPGPASVGASGGLMGLLGFLLVFETIHPRLVPHPTRRRLFAALGMTFLIGFVGYQFIDNWAHGGGLAAGVLYAVLVFPPSRSPQRPRPNRVDLVAGTLAALVLAVSLGLAAVMMLGSGPGAEGGSEFGLPKRRAAP